MKSFLALNNVNLTLGLQYVYWSPRSHDCSFTHKQYCTYNKETKKRKNNEETKKRQSLPTSLANLSETIAFLLAKFGR